MQSPRWQERTGFGRNPSYRDGPPDVSFSPEGVAIPRRRANIHQEKTMSEPALNVSMPKCLNGVNVTALFDTIDAVRNNPQLATFQFRAANEWLEGGHNRSTIQSFFGCNAEDTTRRAQTPSSMCCTHSPAA
jgi:hypothetical protein